MTALEQAFNSLLFLLCQEITRKEAQLHKLQATLDVSFTREQYNEVVNRELKANDQVHMLQRRVHALEVQLAETLKKIRRRRQVGV